MATEHAAMNHAIQQLIDVIGTHPQLAFWVVFAVATGEALLVVGLFVPSTAVLLGAGALVGMGRLAFAPVFIATLAGAIVGDAASYWVGRTWKGRLREVWPFSRFGGLFARSEDFFIAHGAKSVFLGRFVPGIKAMVPGIAGMSGMNPLRFTVVNIVSAVAWSIVHLVPAVMLGRGIDVARLVSPRVLELAAVLVGVALLGWLLLRIALGWMLPRLDRGRLAIVRRLAPSRDGWRGLAWRLLTNEDGTLLSFGLAALALLAAGGFLLLLLNLTLDPELARADAAISQLVQGLRTEVGDQVMVTVTMLGDGVILTSVAVALVLALLAFGEWRIGTSVAIAFSAATIFVPILKTLIHRARPALLYADAQAYSFPSGHAAMATTVLGITALVLGHQLPVRWRRAAWLATTIAVSLIAFSRIYLLAHWPSDVLAGILLGGALTMLLALLLNRQRERIPVAKISGIVTVTLLIAVQTHLYLHFARETERYAIRAPSPASPSLARRPLFDGDRGEPIACRRISIGTPSWPRCGALDGRLCNPAGSCRRMPRCRRVVSSTRARAQPGARDPAASALSQRLGTRSRTSALRSMESSQRYPVAIGFATWKVAASGLSHPNLLICLLQPSLARHSNDPLRALPIAFSCAIRVRPCR